jgi:signal transduction histidine kinase
MSWSIPPLPMEAAGQTHTLANASSLLAKGRILIVNDEPGILTSMRAILTGEGYEVQGVANGHDALAIVHKQAFDLILTDLHPGSEAGLDLLTELRGLTPDPVGIVLIGSASLESATEAIHQGAYDYLARPTEAEELKLTVARALDRQRLQRDLAERARDLEAANQTIQRLNHALRRQGDEATQALQQKIDELAQAKRALEETQQQQNLFLAMVAHELMNPATAIIGYAQYAGQPNQKPERITGSIGAIVSQGERLKRLIRDLQDVSRLATGQFELQRAACNLGSLAHDITEQYRSTHASHRFIFTAQEDAASFQGSYDRDRILQAISNLLDNAVKYSDPDTAVTVRLWTDGVWDCLSVHDEGMGIAPAAQARLFKPFGRLEPARERKIKGSGLGLYITRGIIEAHEGQLLIESGEGTSTGATFTLKFPHTR